MKCILVSLPGSSVLRVSSDVLVEVLISGRNELLNVLCIPPPSPASTLYFKIYFQLATAFYAHLFVADTVILCDLHA